MTGVIVILSLAGAFLQATLLPTLQIAGGMIQLSTIAVVALMFFGSLRYSSIFLLLSAITLSIFTSVPVIYFLLPNFVVLIVLLLLINRRILTKPMILTSFFVFFAAVIVADMVKMAILTSFSLANFYTILPDALFSAVVGSGLYYLANKIYIYFYPQVLREEIKLLR